MLTLFGCLGAFLTLAAVLVGAAMIRDRHAVLRLAACCSIAGVIAIWGLSWLLIP